MKVLLEEEYQDELLSSVAQRMKCAIEFEGVKVGLYMGRRRSNMAKEVND